MTSAHLTICLEVLVRGNTNITIFDITNFRIFREYGLFGITRKNSITVCVNFFDYV